MQLQMSRPASKANRGFTLIELLVVISIIGMLMAAAALLKNIPNPTNADIDTYVDNICRCGTYPRVRTAIHKAAAGSRV